MTLARAVNGCPVNESFDPLSTDFLADPYTVMGTLPREEQPVFFAPSIGYYVLTRYADIEQVFLDPATFSAAVAQAPLVPVVPEAQRILTGGRPSSDLASPVARRAGSRRRCDSNPGPARRAAGEGRP
jgi:cytochrome P450